MGREKKISVVEVFGPTINGEGSVIGVPTIFVRTGGCSFRCNWCDSLHAVLPEHARSWIKHTTDELYERITKLTNGNPLTVTLSGGDPALQPFGDLIKWMKSEGWRFSIETQGAVNQDWFNELDWLVISPKPPSSGMVNDWNKVQACIDAAGPLTHVSLKVVVMNEDDYLFAREVADRFIGIPFYLSVGNDNPPHESEDFNYGSGEFNEQSIVERTEWLIDRVVNDRKNWAYIPTILPQVHTLLWGNKKGV